VILEGPEVIATENTPVCTGEDIVLTADLANPDDFTGFISYEWTGPNGFSSTAQNPVIANASTADEGEEYVCKGEAFTLCTSSFFDYPGGSFSFSPPNSTSVSSAIAPV